MVSRLKRLIGGLRGWFSLQFYRRFYRGYVSTVSYLGGADGILTWLLLIAVTFDRFPDMSDLPTSGILVDMSGRSGRELWPLSSERIQRSDVVTDRPSQRWSAQGRR